MSQKMHNEIVLVTGASDGIGRALVKELVKNGHKVVALARSADKLEYLQNELGSSVYPYTCDVSDEKRVQAVKDELRNKGMLPEIIVCAAAICEFDNNPTYDHDMVRRTLEINFFGTMNFVSSFLPEFKARKSGHFISISSLSSWKPNHRSVSYGASKAAIAMAFRGLSMNKQNKDEEHINFSTIYLGPVNTSMWEGKKSWIVAEPETIAVKIHRLIHRPKPVVYMPFISTTLSRLSLFIPDVIYAKLSRFFFK